MMQTLLTQTPSAPANVLDKAPLSSSAERNGIDSGSTGADNKGDFASLIAKVQGSDKKAQGNDKVVADTTSKSQETRSDRSAKYLANESETIKEQEPDAENKADEVPANDFLLHLQDALNLDTSLVTAPLTAVVPPLVAAVADGNLLPQEGAPDEELISDPEQSSTAGKVAQSLAGKVAADATFSTLGKSTSETSLQPSAGSVTSDSDTSSTAILSGDEGDAQKSDALLISEEKALRKGPMAADGKVDDKIDSNKGGKALSGAERMAQLAKVLPVDELASTVKQGEALTSKESGDSKSDVFVAANNAKTSKGQPAQATTHAATASKESGDSKSDVSVAANNTMTSKGQPAQATTHAATASKESGDSKSDVSVAANNTMTSKGQPAQATTHAATASKESGDSKSDVSVAANNTMTSKGQPVQATTHAATTSKESGDSKSDVSVTANNTMTSKGQPAQATTHAATQGAALKAFSEGLKQPDNAQITTDSAGKGAEKSAAEGSDQRTSSASANQGAAQSVQVTTAQGSVSQSSTTPNTTTQSDDSAPPVMVAPEQVRAQAESQGPQAPLSSISAGIKQMEVTGTDEVRKAAQLEVKPKASEADKGPLATASTGENVQSQTVQHSSSSLTPPQVVENRSPVSDGALRRDPQNLPHLKLASQEAPAELHQKINVMLADKLQQAEIQLDPIGLGKMKIQIQIGADSQANVHFVVQHGQTREMLEQAMPRLREMLAGQGIQLGQTQVQQQSQQQQQQGQPAFTGQGQQGQSGGSSQATTGQMEGDGSAPIRSLLGESTNGSGIDFYA